MQCGNIVLGRVGLVATGFEKKNLVASNGEPGCERCTTRTRADDDIFVVLQSCRGGSVAKGALYIRATVWSECRAIAVVLVSIRLSGRFAVKNGKNSKHTLCEGWQRS